MPNDNYYVDIEQQINTYYICICIIFQAIVLIYAHVGLLTDNTVDNVIKIIILICVFGIWLIAQCVNIYIQYT